MIRNRDASLPLRWVTRAFVHRAGPLMERGGRIASYDAAVRRRRAP